MWENGVSSSQFCSEPKTLLKNKAWNSTQKKSNQKPDTWRALLFVCVCDWELTKCAESDSGAWSKNMS